MVLLNPDLDGGAQKAEAYQSSEPEEEMWRRVKVGIDEYWRRVDVGVDGYWRWVWVWMNEYCVSASTPPVRWTCLVYSSAQWLH